MVGSGPNRRMIIANRTAHFLTLGMIPAVVVLIGALAAAALATPHYNAITGTISHLAIQPEPHSNLTRAALVFQGFMILPVAWAAYRLQGRSWPAAAVWVLLTITGLSVVLLGLVPPNTRWFVLWGTKAPTIHASATFAAAVSFVIALIAEAYEVHERPRWQATFWGAIAVLVIYAGSGAAYWMGFGQSVSGIYERIIIGAAIGWLLAFSVKLFLTGWRDPKAAGW